MTKDPEPGLFFIFTKKMMRTTLFIFFSILIIYSCKPQDSEKIDPEHSLEIGGDFSVMKKLEDFGGVYKVDGIEKQGFQIFKENGYSWARLRIFNSPNNEGPVCNDLEYTIQLAQKAKQYDFKILLDFHYSDTWADPGHQIVPRPYVCKGKA